jgi:hypothetical protein
MAVGMKPPGTGSHQLLAVLKISRRCGVAGCSVSLLPCCFWCWVRGCVARSLHSTTALLTQTGQLAKVGWCAYMFSEGAGSMLHGGTAVKSLTLLSKQVMLLHHEADCGHSVVSERP